MKKVVKKVETIDFSSIKQKLADINTTLEEVRLREPKSLQLTGDLKLHTSSLEKLCNAIELLVLELEK